MTCLNPTNCQRSRKRRMCRPCASKKRVGTKLSDEARQKVSARMKIVMSDPERRKKNSEAKKKLWADPEWRAMWCARRNQSIVVVPEHIKKWDQKMRSAGVPVDQRKAAIQKEIKQQP